jgi:hypothetical protein
MLTRKGTDEVNYFALCVVSLQLVKSVKQNTPSFSTRSYLFLYEWLNNESRELGLHISIQQLGITAESLNNEIAIFFDSRGQLISDSDEDTMRIVAFVRSRNEYRCSKDFELEEILCKCLDDG